MAYLDASTLISALRTSPEVFEFSNGYLRHIPSRHSFHFDRAGDVRVRADCACSFLKIAENQQPALFEAFQEWRTNYWRPIEINREFAAHFRARSWLRRQLIKMTASLLRVLVADRRRASTAKAGLVPAE